MPDIFDELSIRLSALALQAAERRSQIVCTFFILWEELGAPRTRNFGRSKGNTSRSLTRSIFLSRSRESEQGAGCGASEHHFFSWMISETSCAIVCNVPQGLNSFIFATKAHIPRWLNKKISTPPEASGAGLLATPRAFWQMFPNTTGLSCSKMQKPNPAVPVIVKHTHTQPPESLMVVLSKRKLTKQIPKKRRWQKKNTTRVWASYHFLGLWKQTVSCWRRTCIKM
jgi:hypothetical protein